MLAWKTTNILLNKTALCVFHLMYIFISLKCKRKFLHVIYSLGPTLTSSVDHTFSVYEAFVWQCVPECLNLDTDLLILVCFYQKLSNICLWSQYRSYLSLGFHECKDFWHSPWDNFFLCYSYLVSDILEVTDRNNYSVSIFELEYELRKGTNLPPFENWYKLCLHASRKFLENI